MTLYVAVSFVGSSILQPLLRSLRILCEKNDTLICGIIILCGDFDGNGLHLTAFENLRSKKLARGNSKLSKVSY